MTSSFRRANSDDRGALLVWVGTRVAVGVLALAAAWMVVESAPGDVPSWLTAWDRWDAQLFVKIARFGYDGYPGHYADKGVVAFFPGEPLALRAVHSVVRSWVASGLLISAVAGAFAAVALGRLGAAEGDRATGSRAVLYLTLSPYAVFLAAGYSEALFLGFALWSWLFARDRRWVAAGVLGGCAALVRVTGVFLGLALLVQWAMERSGRRWRDLLPLGLPFAVTAGYVVYLQHVTGDWLAWPHAQRDQWHRSLTTPWHAFATTWDSATGNGLGNAYVWSFRAEIVAVLVGVVLSVVLLALRRWAELVYVGGQVAALVRVTGLFLGAALVTQWLLDRSGRRWRDLLPLMLPFVATGGYVVYLHHLTGDWLAWPHAQAAGWHRHLTTPWHAFSTTWDSATGGGIGSAYIWSFRAEIVAVLVGVLLSVTLVVLRRWAELVYVGGQVVALATSSFYLSVARATLLWWPLWLLLARFAADRRWAHTAYLSVAPPLMAIAVIAFLQGHWVG